MNNQTIFFNLDDTLIHCNKYFGIVIEQFIKRIESLFPHLTSDLIRHKQVEIDLASVAINGLTTEHFPHSFVDTYKYFSEEFSMELNDDVIVELYNLGNSVFQMPVEPLPHMYETLEKLKFKGYNMYLHTGGDEANQYRKITQLQLATFFDNRIFVSIHKDTAALKNIVTKMGFDLSNTWMVGNSLRTDVIPGLEVGLNVIYIPAEEEWEFNVVNVDIEPSGAYMTLKSLAEVPDAIQEYVSAKK